MLQQFKSWPMVAITLVLIAIVDIVLLFAADWSPSSTETLSIVIIDVAFLIVMGFTLLVPSSPNSHIFAATSFLTLFAFLVIEVAIGVVTFFMTYEDTSLFLVVQAVLLLGVVAVMIWQYAVNKHSAVNDMKTVEFRNESFLKFKSLAESIGKEARNKPIEKTVESATDAVMSMSMQGKEQTAALDEEIVAKMEELLSAIRSDGEVELLCNQLKAIVARRNDAFRKGQQ